MENHDYLSLQYPPFAYLYGFAIGDGHLYGASTKKGKLAIELAERDRPILERFLKIIPGSTLVERTRNIILNGHRYTNYRLVKWTAHAQLVRAKFERLGFPVGKKAEIAAPPLVPYSEIDFLRGLIDADGSLGLTAQNLPFISLTTYSDSLASCYLGFLERVTGKKRDIHRNKRDNIYNICVFREDAQAVTKVLYGGNEITLPRKLKKSKDVLGWSRPAGMRVRTPQKVWDSEQDAFIKTHSPEESAKELGRSCQSVLMRLWRLGKTPV
jgi:hypothetical protein